MLGGMIALVAVIVGAQHLSHHRISSILEPVLIALLALGVYALYVRLTERRPVTELALSPLLPRLLSGIAFGFALFAAVIGLLMLSGHYRFLGYAAVPDLFTAFLTAITVAVIEELLFRGFLFRVVESLGGTWIGMAVSAIAFGALHGINPHATIASSSAIAIEAGVLLSIAFTVTRSLWFPIGIHIGWNFTEGSIFGVSVSGHAATPGVLHGTLSGPDVITGGAFGVEASVFAVLVCALASAFLIAHAIRTRRIVPLAGTAPAHAR